jgi:DNA (cytosine-5)-methyltransferase 1
LGIRTLDLFAGCGGSSQGARYAGCEIVSAIDKWKLAETTFKDNFPKTRFYCEEMDSFTSKRIRAEFNNIDLILASPECTNHTCAKGGVRRSEDIRSEDSRKTAFHVLKFAKELMPRWIVIENVTQMRSWSRYAEFIESLRRAGSGYQVREQVLNSADFGVPQRRVRLFILCDRKRKPPEVLPTRRRWVPIGKFLEMNGKYSLTPLYSKGRAERTIERARRAIKELERDTPFLIVYYGNDSAGGWQRLDAPLRTITTLDRFALVRKEGRYLMRMLQVPELQAAMGFPDNYKFEFGSRREKIHLLGNAVCPPVMKAVVSRLTH